MAAIRGIGDALKVSARYRTWRVDSWVIKASRGRLLSDLVRHTFRRRRYQRAWRAALHLQQSGVRTPAPIAFAERGFLGVYWGTVLVTEYLDGCRNVEDFLRALVQRGGGPDTVAAFFRDLADAINGLTAARAYHADLSGKNIFTRDGKTFYFIDLDGVELDVLYTEERRLRNHVQLYDSFCDQLSDVVLVPFIERMLTPGQDPRVWMPRVRKAQQERRRRIEEIWERRGRTLRE